MDEKNYSAITEIADLMAKSADIENQQPLEQITSAGEVYIMSIRLFGKLHQFRNEAAKIKFFKDLDEVEMKIKGLCCELNIQAEPNNQEGERKWPTVN